MARGRTTARRLLTSVMAGHWAIDPAWLQSFADLAVRVEDGRAELTAEELRADLRRALASLNEGRDRTEALSVVPGDQLAGARRATIRDGVAIIPVMGPLSHYADDFTDVCGCTAYDQLAQDLAVALASPDVNAILLNVDSPGGEVGGVAEMAAMLSAAVGQKPMATYTPDLMASASLWLGTAVGKGNVYVAPTAIVGSIGVVGTYRAKSKGDTSIEIVSSQSPNKRPDPSAPEGRAQLQSTIDALAEEFVAAIATARGVSPETVVSDFGGGGVLVGSRAVAAGLVDGVSSFEAVLAMLAGRGSASSRGTPAAGGITRPVESTMDPLKPPAADNQPAPPTTADAPPPAAAITTVEALTAAHPELVAQLRATAADAEHTRITGILALAESDAGIRAGAVPVVFAQVKDRAATRGSAAEALYAAHNAAPAAERAAGERYLSAVRADEEQLDPPAPAVEPDNADPNARAADFILNAGKAPGAKPAKA